MRVWVGIAAMLGVSLAACGGGSGSGSNPFGSFGSLGSGSGSLGSGGSGDGAETSEGDDRRIEVVQDDSIVLATIDSAVMEPARFGSILRVTTTTPTQGYHGARLAPIGRVEPDENGMIQFELRGQQPDSVQPTGPARTRQIVVATFIPQAVRDQTRVIRVISRLRVVDLSP